MMIKIERNFFDDDLIEELSTLAIKFYKSNNLRTNFSSWKDGIVQCSSVVLIYDIPQDNKIYKSIDKYKPTGLIYNKDLLETIRDKTKK